jgi:ATP-dependent Zn protease
MVFILSIGFGTDRKVIVLGATNRKELLDPALTRYINEC